MISPFTKTTLCFKNLEGKRLLENIVGNRENASNQLSGSFPHDIIQNLLLQGCVINSSQSRLLTARKKEALENTVGKGENAGNQHFLFFPTVFFTLFKRVIIILATFNLSFATILSFDKELSADSNSISKS